MTDQPVEPRAFNHAGPGAGHVSIPVRTSVALFIGAAAQGPINQAVPCSDFASFAQIFGSGPAAGDLACHVSLFFANCRMACYALRLDAGTPGPAAYQTAFQAVDEQMALFNLLVLAPGPLKTSLAREVYGASADFCRRRRAFLLLDPPLEWSSPDDVLAGLDAFRADLFRDHCALFFPRVTIDEGGQSIAVGAAGAMTGVLARSDAEHGVWHAPLGPKADLRGVTGVEHALSASDSALLASRGVNVLSFFDGRVINCGARTLAGDDRGASEYKYIAVRRLAHFLEESLLRGLQWAAGEPNSELLWAQIRQSAEAFMDELFQMGAFRGQTAREAYLVKCDAETNRQADRNRGIVNVMIGFAPLRPREFVVLTVRIQI